MPWDFAPIEPRHDVGLEPAEAPYPADRPGWCEAIECDRRPPPPRRAAARALPDSDDVLGWSALVFTAPLLATGLLLVAGQAALAFF